MRFQDVDLVFAQLAGVDSQAPVANARDYHRIHFQFIFDGKLKITVLVADHASAELPVDVHLNRSKGNCFIRVAVDNSCLNVLDLAIADGIGKAKTERKNFCYSRSQG